MTEMGFDEAAVLGGVIDPPRIKLPDDSTQTSSKTVFNHALGMNYS
jgi:hypothetical protein